MNLIAQLALIIFIGIISAYIAKRLNASPIIGYIIAGAVISLFINFGTAEAIAINNLAEIGAALLLFSTGIEFSLGKLLEVKKYVIIGGIVQIILTTLLARLIFPLLGFSAYEALFLGSLFSLSSTALIVKILEDRGEIETKTSQITIGWLILQDIAVVILMILLENFFLKS